MVYFYVLKQSQLRLIIIKYVLFKTIKLIKSAYQYLEKTTLSSLFLLWILIVEEEHSFQSYSSFVILHCVNGGFNRRIMMISPFFNQRTRLKRLNLDF